MHFLIGQQATIIAGSWTWIKAGAVASLQFSVILLNLQWCEGDRNKNRK